jgi:thymidylate kinase
VILGTDAAGKDHVADLLIQRWEALGHRVEKRAGSFSAVAADRRSSSDRKGPFDRAMERLFLTFFPLLRPLLAIVLPLMIRRDLRRFRHPDHPVLLVSHTALRLLAFSEAWRPSRTGNPRPFVSALARELTKTGATFLMLTLAPSIREQRIQRRMDNLTADPFDHLMVRDPQLANRFQQQFTALAVESLGAQIIENNNLGPEALERELIRAMQSQSAVRSAPTA